METNKIGGLSNSLVACISLLMYGLVKAMWLNSTFRTFLVGNLRVICIIQLLGVERKHDGTDE